jgi:hypothetical protein
MCRGATREIARGGAGAGTKLAHDGFVRHGVVHSPTPEQGFRPATHGAGGGARPPETEGSSG